MVGVAVYSCARNAPQALERRGGCRRLGLCVHLGISMSAENATRTAAARLPYKFKIMSRWLAFGASWPLQENEEKGMEGQVVGVACLRSVMRQIVFLTCCCQIVCISIYSALDRAKKFISFHLIYEQIAKSGSWFTGLSWCTQRAHEILLSICLVECSVGSRSDSWHATNSIK